VCLNTWNTLKQTNLYCLVHENCLKIIWYCNDHHLDWISLHVMVAGARRSWLRAAPCFPYGPANAHSCPMGLVTSMQPILPSNQPPRMVFHLKVLSGFTPGTLSASSTPHKIRPVVWTFLWPLAWINGSQTSAWSRNDLRKRGWSSILSEPSKPAS
jgi:hypothetical protein